MLTPMRLMLLRHAKAEKAEPGMSDRDRGLNGRGHSDASRMGAYMAHHSLRPDRCIVSAARRTRETWEGVAAALSPPPPVSDEDRLYGAGHDAILAVIAETGRARESLLVIGHNPGLHKLARRLIATGDVEARERLNEALPTSGLVVIDFAGDNWHELGSSNGRLERFVTPRSLRAASD
jgi:phosphohistidine phosphatase